MTNNRETSVLCPLWLFLYIRHYATTAQNSMSNGKQP